MYIKTIPNILTFSRIIFVPFFIVFFYSNLFYYKLLSLILFFVCSLTDFLDGYLARKYNLVTTIGKFIDPLADKILILSAFFIIHNEYPEYIPFWMILGILFRDVLITSLRLFLKFKNKSLKTSILAKGKTLFQIIVIHLMLCMHVFNSFDNSLLTEYVFYTLMLLCVLFTIFSGIHYLFINLFN